MTIDDDRAEIAKLLGGEIHGSVLVVFDTDATDHIELDRIEGIHALWPNGYDWTKTQFPNEYRAYSVPYTIVRATVPDTGNELADRTKLLTKLLRMVLEERAK